MTEELPLSPDDVAEIVAILDASRYREIDVSTRRFRLRVARAEGDDAGFTQEWEWAGAAGVVSVVIDEVALVDPEAICAPLPGTFYHAPQPGAPPFVQVGDEIGPETVVGIVETMKLMNPVHAGRSGIVQAIIAPNATMVAKGDPLVRVA